MMEGLLVPAGDGVYTVHTKSELRERLQSNMYGDTVETSYCESYPKSSCTKPIVLGVPFDTGAGIQRGANWGPLYLRMALLDEGKSWRDLGDIRVIPHLLHDKYLSKEMRDSISKSFHKDKSVALPVSPLSMAEVVAATYFKKYKAPLFILGGDHSITRPFAEEFIETYENTAIIHFDAHTDLMKERQGVDMCFATWANHLSKKVNNKNKFYQIGIRSSGKDKAYWERELPVKQYWADEVLSESPTKIGNEIVEKLNKAGVKNLYISIDIDVLDERYAALCGTPEPHGLMPHHLIDFLNIFSQFKISAIDLVELAPHVSYSNNSSSRVNSLLTAGQLAVKILEILEKQCP